MPVRIDLSQSDDPRDAVHRAVQSLVEGKVVGLPTDTVYGLAASALSESAVDAIYEIKGRQADVPLAVSVASMEAAMDFVSEMSPLASRLASRCWPGPLTLVLPCGSEFSAVRQLPESVQKRILGPGDCVGFRVIGSRVMEHIHHLVSAPLVLTSANRSGDPSPQDAQAALDSLGDVPSDKMPLLLDDGPTKLGAASTVVRVADKGMEILRTGAIEAATMNQFAKPIIAVVCTGNTCRSPMAETLLREQVQKRFGREDAIGVVSAGLAAAVGMGASPQAVQVMGKRNLDLTGHASRPLDDEVVRRADLILTMTRNHRRAILAAWPNLADRVHTLRRDGGDISDPIGAAVEVYEQCAAQMETEIALWLDEYGDRWNLENHA
ncbi:MAG: L-threonylcarbamoyladenylate synthase [Planctomycetota bacterium]